MTNDALKKDIRSTSDIKTYLFFRQGETLILEENAYLYTRVKSGTNAN